MLFVLVIATKTECDYLGLDSKTVTYAKISPKMVNSREIAGSAEEEEEECVLVMTNLNHVQRNF